MLNESKVYSGIKIDLHYSDFTQSLHYIFVFDYGLLRLVLS